MKKKGFSLVEVMVVIVILGILAAVAVPQVFNMIERSKRKIDATNAMELANILDRAYGSGVITFPENSSYNITSNNGRIDVGMSVAVFVNKNGTNYYRGSGSVLVNGGDYHSDNGVAYRRIQRLFEEAGFVNVAVNSKNPENSWECYGAALFAGGVIKIFSSANASECTTTTAGGNYETVLNRAMNGNNPIKPYLSGKYAQ
ncbi:MAG: type II secretion system GspH family protein [Fibrobacter sp.]|nr:type II secretion system GspH family protein [Fibrobacter sp.]